MKKKDLGQEYATARLQGRLSGNEIQFDGHEVFTEADIEAAFNAGRESVVSNIPDLEWKEVSCDLEEYFTSHQNGWYYKVSFRGVVFEVCCNGYFIRDFLSLSEAKQAANEDYKQRIKQTLGL